MVNTIRGLLVSLASLVLLCSCAGMLARNSYENAQLGIKLEYPSTWHLSTADVRSPERGKMAPSKQFESTASIRDKNVNFGLVKLDESNSLPWVSSIMVIGWHTAQEKWGGTDPDAELLKAMAREGLSPDGSSSGLATYSLPNYPSIRNFAKKMSILDIPVGYYHYIYWHQPYLVYVIAMYRYNPANEKEIQAILSTMQFKSTEPTTGAKRKQ